MSEPDMPAENNKTDEVLISDAADLNDQVPTFVDLLPEQALPYWQFVQQYPLIEAATIFCVFWILAYLIRRYAIALIQKLTSRTESTLDDNIIDELRAPIFSSVIWFGLIIASKSTGFTDGAFEYIAPFASTMIVLGLLRAALSISSQLITALSREEARFKNFDVRTEPLFIITSKILLMVVGAYVTLLIWGINPVGLLASAGIVGIAVGFAAKDTLANLFSGVFILADRPYKLGDYVNLDGGERGKVTHIGIRSTRILTNDDIEVTIPNGVIGNGKVVNESGGSHQKMRIRLNVQCSYEEDLDRVEQVLMGIADTQAEMCKHPAPRVRVRGLADSGIDLQLMGWINNPKDKGRVSHLLYKAIHKSFAEHNIEIPYPKRDLHILKQG